MGDSQQASKKRGALKELSRDNPGLDDEDDSAEMEFGTFKKASDEVLANRRILRVKRKEASATAPSSNPFAGIRLVTSGSSTNTLQTNSSLAESKSNLAEATGETVAEGEKSNDTKETKVIGKENEADAENGNNEVKEEETEKEKVEDNIAEKTKKATDDEIAEKNEDGSALSSFQQHSSNKNAFIGVSGTGFSSSMFSFGSVSQEGPSTGSGSLFGQKPGQSSFGFGLSNNGSSSVFGASGTSIITKSEGSAFPPKQEVSVETGEENERVAFSADSVLFEFFDGSWKERGKGEVKVNVSTCGSGKSRLLMRSRGNYRLILNAGLFPDMKLANMDKKGITFACVNSIGEDKDSLSTFALKFKDVSFVEEFRSAVMQYKDSKPEESVPLKPPENSPDA